jgi:hypothetical protein
MAKSEAWNERMCSDPCDIGSCKGNIEEAKFLDFSECNLEDFPEEVFEAAGLEKIIVATAPPTLRLARLMKNTDIVELNPKPVLGVSVEAESGGEDYLYVEAGDPYSLGYLTGEALSGKIALEKVGLALVNNIKRRGTDYDELAERYLDHIPEEYVAEMLGMADGAGRLVNFSDILLQNVILDIGYGQLTPEDPDSPGDEMGCTAIGLVKGGGSVDMGQNFDLNPAKKRLLSFVHHKLEGGPEVFSLRLGGAIGMPIGKNSHGVASTVNIVKTTEKGHFSAPASVRARMALDRAASAAEFIDIATRDISGRRVDHTASFNLMASDEKQVISIQVRPSKVERRVAERGGEPLVNTNRYLNAGWNEEVFAKGDYSLTRQERAEREARALLKGERGSVLEILKLEDPADGLPESEICRTTGSSRTLAFLTREAFGLGAPCKQDGAGTLPF